MSKLRALRRRYSVARGVLAQRRKRAHASGHVTRKEADSIHQAERRVHVAYRALKTAMRPAPRIRALNHAQSLIGTRERGGNNVGPKVSAIIRAVGGTPGEPWCGDFVAYCYLKAGVGHKITRAWAYVPTLERVLTYVKKPKAGHIVIYNWGGGVADHTGLFERWVIPGYRFQAIEGNTKLGSNVSDGGGGEGVERRVRTVSEVQSFRRVIK